MNALAGTLMIANALLFFFGAAQHAGVRNGSFHEPLIIPAAIVEAICGACLIWGGAMLLRRAGSGWRSAMIANVVAFAGVLLGIAALAAGAGPRTASNDLYHRIMLVLIAASMVLLMVIRSRGAQRAP